MIHFISINIEGFASIDKLEYKLDWAGLNLIQGKNGAGKTTLFSALFWCLWGKPLKGSITPWQPSKDYRGTKVHLIFRVGLEVVQVVRCKDFKDKVEGTKGGNRLLIYFEDKYQEKYRDKDDAQKKIEDILGMSANLFKNCLVFGQNLTRLLASDGTSQKKLFDEAFQVTYLNKAKELVSKDLSEREIKLGKLRERYDNFKYKYKTLKQSITLTKEFWQNEHNKQVQQLEESLVELSKKLTVMEGDKEEYEKLKTMEEELREKLTGLTLKEGKLQNLENKHFKVDLELKQLKDSIPFIKTELRQITEKLSSKVKECPLCKQPLEDTFHKQLHKKLLDSRQGWKKELETKNNKIVKLNAELAKLESSIKRYGKYKKELRNIENQLEQIEMYGYEQVTYRPHAFDNLKKQVEEIKQKLKQKKLEKPDLDKLINEKRDIVNKLKGIKPKYKEVSKEVKRYRWLINEPLSNRGIKTYIFNSMLSSVNDRLRYYGKYTGFTVVLSMDVDSGRKNFKAQVYYGDTPVDYTDLSGGEKQMVDVCLAFSIHDVKCNGYIDLLLMDEVFESLDENNIEVVAELLPIKAHNTKIHLITHRKEINSVKFSRITYVTKRRGVTKIVENTDY